MLSFEKLLRKEYVPQIPLFCTGWPDPIFMNTYHDLYPEVISERSLLEWNGHNLMELADMGWDSLSIWSFRKGPYVPKYLPSGEFVDFWGRIYKKAWYTGKGVLHHQSHFDEIPCYPKIPSKIFEQFSCILPSLSSKMYPIVSLPGIFEKTWQAFGYIEFAKSLRKNELLVHEIADRLVDFLFPTIRKLLSIGLKTFMFMDDIAYKQRTFLSPPLWLAIFGAKYQLLINYIHDHGGYVILHSDGDIRPMMDHFIQLKFDGLQGLEYLAGVNLFEAIQEWGQKITLIGGLDVSTTLSFGNIPEVRSNLDKIFKIIQKKKISFIISPSQGITASVKPELIHEMLTYSRRKNFSL